MYVLLFHLHTSGLIGPETWFTYFFFFYYPTTLLFHDVHGDLSSTVCFDLLNYCSQNILELLHKVDQSREHGVATNTSTSNRPLSSRVMDTESSDGDRK